MVSISNRNSARKKGVNEYPFGMQVKDRSWSDSSYSYRFGFNGKESDDEVSGEGNNYDFGARIYDSRLGRWLAVDPLHQFNSDYLAMGNSPILARDVDGRWVPEVDKDGKIYLRAEEGDNLLTLYKYFGNDQATFYKHLSTHKRSYSIGDKQYIREDLVESKAFKHANENTDIYEEDAIFDLYEQNYNCYAFAETIVKQDKQLEKQNYKHISGPWEIEALVKNKYVKLSEEQQKTDMVVGETILVVSGDTWREISDEWVGVDRGNTQHAAVYYGTTKDGTIMVMTKNGQNREPEIMSLKDLQEVYSTPWYVDDDWTYEWYNPKSNETESD